MNDEFFRMIEIAQDDMLCSQILVKMGLEAQGKTDPDLVRAMGGLAGGLGFCGKICGALSGGACLIALYAGKGSPEEAVDSRFNDMVRELVTWFENEYGSVYGSIECKDILNDNPQNKIDRCPQITFNTYQKVKEILEKNDYTIHFGAEASQ
jgi:C_GCAxxG_C_C family probable redox protein